MAGRPKLSSFRSASCRTFAVGTGSNAQALQRKTRRESLTSQKKTTVSLIDGSEITVVTAHPSTIQALVMSVKDQLGLKHDIEYHVFRRTSGQKLLLLDDSYILTELHSQSDLVFQKLYSIQDESFLFKEMNEVGLKLAYDDAVWKFLNSNFMCPMSLIGRIAAFLLRLNRPRNRNDPLSTQISSSITGVIPACLHLLMRKDPPTFAQIIKDVTCHYGEYSEESNATLDKNKVMTETLRMLRVLPGFGGRTFDSDWISPASGKQASIRVNFSLDHIIVFSKAGTHLLAFWDNRTLQSFEGKGNDFGLKIQDEVFMFQTAEAEEMSRTLKIILRRKLEQTQSKIKMRSRLDLMQQSFIEFQSNSFRNPLVESPTKTPPKPFSAIIKTHIISPEIHPATSSLQIENKVFDDSENDDLIGEMSDEESTTLSLDDTTESIVKSARSQVLSKQANGNSHSQYNRNNNNDVNNNINRNNSNSFNNNSNSNGNNSNDSNSNNSNSNRNNNIIDNNDSSSSNTNNNNNISGIKKLSVAMKRLRFEKEKEPETMSSIDEKEKEDSQINSIDEKVIDESEGVKKEESIVRPSLSRQSSVSSVDMPDGISLLGDTTSDDEKLPSHWHKVEHNESGQKFYWNSVTEESVNEKPNESGENTNELPPNWQELYDENSESYYYWNAETEESRWEKPTI
eukprot:TRINITY_DN1147_c9_g1_i1.p1 TRINITY_DN1147_c9_g1~~TRINITY_DN1147_c9_g1_i1.p1  ORF type:complete len:683 (-),score=175.42 TRINITY_DN1147_c9_g1_i1:93-2141(-)